MKTNIMTALLCALAITSHAASIGLAWNPNSESDLAGYRLYQGTNSGTYTKVVDVGNVTTAVATDLEEGIRYFWVVTAYNTTGLESEPSNEVDYLVPSPEPATAPAGLVATRSATEIVLVWERNPDGQFIRHYRVSWLPVGETVWQTADTPEPRLPTFTIPLSGRIAMAVKVSAIGPKGEGPAATLTLPGLISPTGLVVDANSISWIE